MSHHSGQALPQALPPKQHAVPAPRRTAQTILPNPPLPVQTSDSRPDWSYVDFLRDHPLRFSAPYLARFGDCRPPTLPSLSRFRRNSARLPACGPGGVWVQAVGRGWDVHHRPDQPRVRVALTRGVWATECRKEFAVSCVGREHLRRKTRRPFVTNHGCSWVRKRISFVTTDG